MDHTFNSLRKELKITIIVDSLALLIFHYFQDLAKHAFNIGKLYLVQCNIFIYSEIRPQLFKRWIALSTG